MSSVHRSLLLGADYQRSLRFGINSAKKNLREVKVSWLLLPWRACIRIGTKLYYVFLVIVLPTLAWHSTRIWPDCTHASGNVLAHACTNEQCRPVRFHRALLGVTELLPSNPPTPQRIKSLHALLIRYSFVSRIRVATTSPTCPCAVSVSQSKDCRGVGPMWNTGCKNPVPHALLLPFKVRVPKWWDILSASVNANITIYQRGRGKNVKTDCCGQRC